jgi:hypothetical protein
VRRLLLLAPFVALAAIGAAFWRRQENPVRELLDALGAAADALAAYLERIYEEAFLETEKDDDDEPD